MKRFNGVALSWGLSEGVIELAMHRPPANEIGPAMLTELEQFVAALESSSEEANVLTIHSQLQSGFSAGRDLRELYAYTQTVSPSERVAGIRTSLELSHRVFNAIDSTPLVTIAAIHGVCFGGGFELALTCDLMIADKLARFCFPELRLGLIPGGAGIPRLKRDLGNGVVCSLLLTGCSMSASKALDLGLISQLAAEGEALSVARSTAAQIKKFDATARISAKRFLKPIPRDELQREIEIFCELFSRPVVLRKFVENRDVMPYLA